MAKTRRVKLDYVGWSVDLFDSDTKIDKLLDAQGWSGFGIYFYLCMRAYGSEGYFYRWCYDDCATTARRMGGGIGSGTVKETVGYCLQIGLFDKGLFDRWGILTSKGIQRKYWEVMRRREDKRVTSEFWLIGDETDGVIFVPQNSDFTAFDPKGKKRKVEEKKVEERTSAPAPEPNQRRKYGEYGWVQLTEKEYERLLDQYGQQTIDFYIRYIDESAQLTGNKNKWKDWNLTLRKAIRNRWGVEGANKGQMARKNYDDDEDFLKG